MGLAQFLSDLFEHGRVRVGSGEMTVEELLEADRRLAECEADLRAEFPGRPPDFSPQAARWAAVQMYFACRCVVDRDLPAELIRHELARPCPLGQSPSVHYSVDVSFRFLPDLIRLARALSEADPLVQGLRELAQRWPLSSVGIPGLGPVSIDTMVQHPGLLRLYADRIVQTGDGSRMQEARVREAVGVALGSDGSRLAPELARQLEQEMGARSSPAG